MNKIAGFIRLVRPINGLMMGVAVVVGASLVLAEPLSSHIIIRLFFGYITAFTLTAASMVINDYYDREIDKINEPDRPIIVGVVTSGESLVLAAVLTVIGFATAFLTNLSCLVLAVLSWVISVTYNTKGKKTGLLGNFLVSSCVAIPFIYGGFVIKELFELETIFYASLAFLSNTGREVTKGIVDIEGDKTQNIRTIAISHGQKAAAYLASCFFLSAVFLSFVPPILNMVSVWFFPFITVADLGFTVSSVMLIREPSRRNARRIKNLVMLWMMFSLASFFVGSL